ncbi:sugar hydrolase [Streptomyces azureus]|uniref:Sugar hydrolase n=1 Tax=Streptomyces azureus TaxID=146537 RepID=A0A0K8PF71_STRAJ|nr:sugar hydrolase [Streptomyces azureus]
MGGLGAVDFHDQSCTEIVNRAKRSGGSVAPVSGRRGELMIRDCDFGKGAARITVETAGEGTVELALGDGPVWQCSRFRRVRPGPTTTPW